MRRAKNLLASILFIGIFLTGGLEVQAIAGGGKSPAKTALSADLDLVPRNAVGFVHMRAAELWGEADVAKELRYLVHKAGPEAWKAFEKKSPINPATLDRITLIWLSPQMTEPFPSVDPEAMSALVVVTTSKPFDRLPLIQALGTKEKVYRDNLYYFNEELWSGLLVVDERTFVIASEESLIQLFDMSRQMDRTGPLQAPLMEAARKHHVVVGLNPTLLGNQAAAGILPPSARTLLKAQSAVLTLDLDEGIRLNTRLDFLNEDQARDGETAARQTLDLARQGLVQPIAEMEKMLNAPDKNSASDLPQHFAVLVGLGFLRELDSQLKEAPLQRQGSAVKLPLSYKNQAAAPLVIASFGATLMLGARASATFDAIAPSKVGGPDPLEQHLRTLAKAFESYREKHGTYPPRAIHDRDGRPVLSWRVALLSHLGEESLYKEFKLDEPWDSLHNKRLLKKMPAALRVATDYRYGSTQWKSTTQIFTGANTLFEGNKGVRPPDGAKVILLARLSNEAGVYWTKPADVSYAADQPLPDFYGKYGNRIQVLLTDGTYRAIDKSMDEKSIRALIEPNAERPLKVKSLPKLGELETIWKDLTQNDDIGTKKAWQGIAAMSKTPERTVPFLKERVKPVPPPDLKRIAKCLTDIESNIFKKRAQAIIELESFGDLALPAIDKKLRDKSISLEARRQLDSLAQKTRTVLSGEELRSLRAVEILEQVGTPEARAILGDLARGGEGAVLTAQARRALARLAQRSVAVEK